MSDYEKSADFTSQAARLNLLEEKVRNTKPGDAAADNRLDTMLAGAEAVEPAPIPAYRPRG